MANTKGQDVFYNYPELYQLRNKKTGRKLLNCASKYDCERELRAIKIKDWKLAQDLVIIKLDRKRGITMGKQLTPNLSKVTSNKVTSNKVRVVDKNRTTKLLPHIATPTSLKLTTCSTFSTKSFEIYFAYLSNHLSNLNFNLTPTVKVTDWNETKDSIVLKRINESTFTLGILEDCYFQSYSSLEEAIFDLVVYVENNILPVANSKRKGN